MHHFFHDFVTFTVGTAYHCMKNGQN